MRAWSALRQLLAATLCAVLALPACSSAAPLSSSTPSHTYDAETLSKTRVWGSNEKILLHFRAVLLVSEKQHRGCEKCRWKNVVGSVVTYDYDAFGNLIHSTGTTPNNYLFAGEQFDPDLNLYYNRARYLNTGTGRFWNMDTYQGDTKSPLSLHKYLYTHGSPVDRTDPSGNGSIDELLIAFAVSAIVLTMSGCGSKQPQIITVGVDFQNAWDLGPDPADVLTGPEQDLLKQTVMQTLRDAYKGYAVIFSAGPSSTRSITVSNDLGPGAGLTNWPAQRSDVYFWNLWSTLESLLGCNHLSECVRKGGYDRTTLATALGQGVGATAAHELGHQGGLNFVSHVQGCDSCYDAESAQSRAHFFAQGHWSDGAKARMREVLPMAPGGTQ